ncbi:MAG: cell division protein SepF [Clostridia bacterium]|nr:cell division protein SepF [Clostridia bacterium]
MAFWDDAKNKVLQAMKPRQQEEHQVLSNRADGGFSGYVPKMNRPQQEPMPTGMHQARPAGFENMMPTGVDPSVMQNFQPVGGQTGAFQQPGQGMQPQQGMPQQGPQAQQPPFGRTGYQQPVNPQMPPQPAPQQMPPRPQAQFQGQPGQQFQPQPQQPTRPGFGQPAFQQNEQQSRNPLRFFTARQNQAHQPAPQMPPVQPMQPAQPVQPVQNVQPAQEAPQTFAFPGESYVVDGNAYKLIFRVAQITGVPSCFRVIEFMYNNEAVIVNAEQITDLVEADRCMDLIFGAACAMKQRLMRVSGKQIYLITPPQVYVAPFEPLRRAGMADIERRWPGALQTNMQPQQMGNQPFVNNVQPMGNPQGQQTMGFNQARQGDFAGGFGRRAARSQMHTNGYTDYGGFGMKSR